MINNSEQLNKVATKTATQWIDRANTNSSKRRSIKRAQLFALELMEYMDTNGIKQIDLADRMDVSPQQVNKILRAKANLTFETLDKIADALGVNITTPKIVTSALAVSKMVSSSMKVVHRGQSTKMEKDLNTTIVNRKNPILETTIENMNDYSFTADQI